MPVKNRKRKPRAFDPNLHLAYVAGQRARLENKPATACPSLRALYGESYGTVLADQWMRGWHDRDKAERQMTMMKGAD